VSKVNLTQDHKIKLIQMTEFIMYDYDVGVNEYNEVHYQHKQNPEKQRDYAEKRGKWWLESRYGIGEVEWRRMFDAQLGRCVICDSDDPKGNHGVFHVDHCHETGKVRGLLCDTCNRGLGMFYDNTNILKSAIEYLEKHRENQKD